MNRHRVAATAFAADMPFVTPALSYSTRSVVRALDNGLGMISETWPQSAVC